MTERLRRDSCSNGGYISGKMASDIGLSPRKTMLIMVIVVGCFAVLWPKVFYPMLLGSANHHIKPSPIDRTKGCCDVISETDVHTLEIMSEICNTITRKDEVSPITGRELVTKCRNEILETCGIDISAVLQEQIRLGQTTKQILDEVRSLNGSLCLKYNFGVAPWKLGVPHRITVKESPFSNIKQERPLHLRSEMVHPAFRERGRAIPQTQPSPKSSPPPRVLPKVVPGRPGPIPSMRPTIGGAGHVVPAQKQSVGSMGLVMPIYTIAIVIFFAYTVMKIVFKKQPETLYPSVEPDPLFRKQVFEADRSYFMPKMSKDRDSTKLVVNAMSALLDEVDQELASRRKDSESADQNGVPNGKIGGQDEDQGSVKVMGMETRASCEGGKKWSRPESPVSPINETAESESAEPPQEIFLEGALPPQSHLLVTDSATETQNMNSEEDPAVVLAGKMTLSVISLDSDESSSSAKKYEERSSNGSVSEDFEKLEIDAQLDEINEKAQKEMTDDELNAEGAGFAEKELFQTNIDGDVKDTEMNENTKIDHSFESKDSGKSMENNQGYQIEEDIPEKPQSQSDQNDEEELETVNTNIIEANIDAPVDEERIQDEDAMQQEQSDNKLEAGKKSEECLMSADVGEQLIEEAEESKPKHKEEEKLIEKKTEEEEAVVDDKEKEEESLEDEEEEVEEVDDEEEEEEIVYDYEESDNEEVNEEIRNAVRMVDEENVVRVNGSNHDESKYDERMNDLGENDDEDEEVEEIIEYVTDEEEEEIEHEEPRRSNNINHVDEEHGADNSN